MASAGRLHVSIEARIEKLEEGLARADRRVQQSSQRMQSLGASASNVAARGLRVMSAAMSAAGAASAASEKQWLSLSAIILTNFAMGGPVVGAISVAGAAVGILMSKSSEAARKWEEDMRRIASATEKAAADVRSADESMFVGRGGTRSLFQLEGVERRLDELVGIRESVRGKTGFSDQATRERVIAEQAAQKVLRENLLSLANREAAVIEQRLEDENALLVITDDRARKIAEINLEMSRTVELFQAMQEKGIAAPGGGTWDDAIEAAIRNAELRTGQLPERLKEVSEAAKLAARSVSDVMSAFIVDGASAENVLRSLARTFLSMGIQKGVGAVFGVSGP